MTNPDQFPELYSYFAISSQSDLDLDDITLALRIEPTRRSVRGSRIPSPPHPRFNVWTLETPRERSVDAEPIIAGLVDKLERSRDGLAGLQHNYAAADFGLTLVAYIVVPDGVTPAITLSAELLSRIVSLGLDFGISLYLTSDEAEVTK